MRTAQLTLPEIMTIAGTRVMAGAGAALLLADRLTEEQRKAVGWTLFAIGAVSTVPLLVNVLMKSRGYDSGAIV